MDSAFKSMVQSMINDMETITTTEKENNDRGSTRGRNILGKLDSTSLTSLKADFDKALPKWTWKTK